jgi:maltose O-acetyltransferase
MEKRVNYHLNIKFIYKAFLGYLAYFAFYPSFMPALLNKFRGVNIKNPFKVVISPFVTIDTIFPELVTIEKDVYITRGCYILSHFNPTEPISKIMNINNFRKPVKVKEGAFIGVNSIILPGVTIGKCAIINAGSVVNCDVPDFNIFGGNPAKKVGRLPRTSVRNILIES